MEQGSPTSPLWQMCHGSRNRRCRTSWYGLKARLIKPPQTSRTKQSPSPHAEILRHATGEEQRVGYNARRTLLSLWKEATQVLLTQGLLPEIAFGLTWLSGIWNEPLMDAEVILCPCGPFIAFKLSCLYSFPPSFFSRRHHFGPQKLLLMHFIPGALTVHAASPEKRISDAAGRQWRLCTNQWNRQWNWFPIKLWVSEKNLECKNWEKWLFKRCTIHYVLGYSIKKKIDAIYLKTIIISVAVGLRKSQAGDVWITDQEAAEVFLPSLSIHLALGLPRV